ncbi:hypothetical protein JTB14_035311 [Gonioctena quinquepunctata]|nr:hypothetical protein JTB14_035311 [Gonioctena quinquepunctata]
MSANVDLRRSQRIKEKGEDRKRVASQVKSCPELLKSHSCITEGSETRTAPKMSETFKMSKSVPAESRGSRSRGSRTTSKTKKSDSKRHQAELEFALEKKKLEQEELRRKQEMLDIELALKLSKLEDEELCSEKSEISEMVSRPDIKKWVEGEHPWQDKLDGASFSSAKKEEKDNRIRIVDVQLANGTILRRPVSRLCVLDIQRKTEIQ